MSKKFVKTDFGSTYKKQQKPPPSTYEPKYYKKTKPVQYYQKPICIELRKYFQVVPIDTQLQQLIQKFPGFFCQISFHPQNIKNYKTKPQNPKFGYYVQQQKPVQEQVAQWESQGQIELGAKINPQKIKECQNIKPIKINELKPHEIQFLQEEFKRKLKQQEQLKQLQNKKNTLETKIEIANQKQIEKKQSSSDEEIQITKEIKFQKDPQPTVQTKYYQEDIQFQEDDDDNKFADSSQSSDDDIFGQDQDEEKPFKQQQSQQNNINHGRISYSKGLFSLFTFNLGINEDEKVWSIHNRIQGLIKSSKQMDSQYLSNFKSYEFIAFKQYAYIHYEAFKANPSLELFKLATQQQQQQHHHQQQQQQNSGYKYNNNTNGNNSNNHNYNKRKMSNHYYKNNKKQYI